MTVTEIIVIIFSIKLSISHFVSIRNNMKFAFLHVRESFVFLWKIDFMENVEGKEKEEEHKEKDKIAFR